MSERADALRRAVEAAPDDLALRAMLVDELATGGLLGEALEHAAVPGLVDRMAGTTALALATAAVEAGRLDLAMSLLTRARAAGVVEGIADVEQMILGGREQVLESPDDSSGWDLDAPESPITFSAVGGMEDVKKTINRMIVLPFSRPELYERYRRRSGGGVLLYGPPGCGKTLVARATAGEIGIPFYTLRIEDVVDPYFGRSERNLVTAFDRARELRPCVLFIDEIDALGFTRTRTNSESGRKLVDVLLQQLDSIGTDTSQLLVLAATNAPWDVDSALLRPGRFDKRVFVPPPDERARVAILEVLLRELHADPIDVRKVASRTPLFSGADLRGVVESAIDHVIDQALESGTEPPLAEAHLETALDRARPTTFEWLSTARNYVEFANQNERWSDVAEYLSSREARRLMKQWRS